MHPKFHRPGGTLRCDDAGEGDKEEGGTATELSARLQARHTGEIYRANQCEADTGSKLPCFKPLNAWQKAPGMPPQFSPINGNPIKLQLPCGQCIGCRLERSRQTASRCMHEAQFHDENCFITLTYDQAPYGETLVKPHFQKFMKRLRHHLAPKKIRFYMCGEYGEELQRPHYHALIFGHDFEDKKLWASKDGAHTYTSDSLESIWGKGFATVAELTWESAAYCSRYILKKQTGKAKAEAYKHLVLETGELIEKQAEYTTASLKPAIGRQWYETYKRDCYPKDFITHRGKKFRVPKYYDKLLEKTDPNELARIKRKRIDAAQEHNHNNTGKRLATREKVAEARTALLKRTI